ncbi:MAG: amino acid transport protein [Planctomycetes bacterium]|nr:amino acid transport protein [Planctomycetota bacterium]
MEPESLLMYSLLFSSIGMGYFIYGKKQKRSVPLISGVILCAYPYFVTNPILFFGVGAVVTVIPYFVRQ